MIINWIESNKFKIMHTFHKTQFKNQFVHTTKRKEMTGS